MADYKMIYSIDEALVSDELINGGDANINAALPNSKAGMMIYSA